MRILTDTAVPLPYRPECFADALLPPMPVSLPWGTIRCHLPPSHTSRLQTFPSRLPPICPGRIGAAHTISISTSRTGLSPVVVCKHRRIDVVWEFLEATVAISVGAGLRYRRSRRGWLARVGARGRRMRHGECVVVWTGGNERRPSKKQRGKTTLKGQ